MRNVREIALSAFAALALGSAPAIAGEWSSGCGVCQLGYHAPPATYYTQPTYAYAAPTVTVVPHVIVEPNYIVQQTYVVRQNHYADDLPPAGSAVNPTAWSIKASIRLRNILQAAPPMFIQAIAGAFTDCRSTAPTGPFAVL